MSHAEFTNGLNPANYQNNESKEKPTIKSVILEVLKKENEREKLWKDRYPNKDWYKYIQPYRFLDNPTMCRLLECQLLKLYIGEFYSGKPEYFVNEKNFEPLVKFLYNENLRPYGGMDFEKDKIVCSTYVYPTLTTGWDAMYTYHTSKDDEGKDIVKIFHFQTGSHVYNPYYKKEILVIDRSGLQTESIITSGFESYGEYCKSYILKRSTDNIYLIEMKEYPDGLKKTKPEDIKTYEIDLKDLIDISTKFPIDSYDSILKRTMEDPLLIPNISILSDKVCQQLEEKRRQPGEITMTPDDINRRIEKDCQNKAFKKTMQQLGLIQTGR